jgi:hypothetical protein
MGTKWRMFADLWERSWRFERAHDFEHVEDCLINKRVVYGDEWDQLWGQLGDDDWIPGSIVNLPVITQANGQTAIGTRLLRKISEVNRLRQSYLSLRDWMKRRPWQVTVLLRCAQF